jgi:peptide/nickel transport system ATP-binding protein/oligopeptide transport system ATP-binding protein
MRQRAMIAIALASNPKLLLADEPTTALDVTIQDQILKLILRLRSELKMSVVLVTHDLGVIAQTCDRLAVMYAGRVVETGPVTALFRQPRHAYTLGLLNSVPRADLVRQPLASIPGQPPLLFELPPGCAFAPRCRFVTEACTAEKPPLIEVAAGHRSACIHHDQVAVAP